MCVCVCVEMERTAETYMHVTLAVRNRMFQTAFSSLGSEAVNVLILPPPSLT